MRIQWRKINRVLHRDLGYFFFGMTLIYALSGIALNHKQDWNPNYEITNQPVHWQEPAGHSITKEVVLDFLARYGQDGNYKKYYLPEPNILKIFIRNGSITIDLGSGQGNMEMLHRRPLLFQVNYLHYNPNRLWTWFSDLFSAALIIIAITGLFIIKGKKGITGRGAWLTAAGLLVPIGFLLVLL